MLRNIIRLLVIMGLCLGAANFVQACVGRTLYIGALQSNHDKLMAEMVSLLINERTGTTVQIRYFDNNAALYKAAASNKEESRVDIMVEDTIDALRVLKKTPSGKPDEDYLTAKKIFARKLNIIWLNPFGYQNTQADGRHSESAPLLRRDVLNNFPLLPRVLNKLSGAVSNRSYKSLMKKVEDGKKPRNVARDFLKRKKLI